MISSTIIQSPTLILFSTKTKIPDIKFLNKSLAPNATATPNKPKPAIIGPIFIPQSSRTAAAPRIIIKILNAFIIQFNKSFDKRSSTALIKTEIGPIIWCNDQKIRIVISVLFALSTKFSVLSPRDT